MNRILFLVHRIPFPPDKGDKIRSFNILRYLSRHHRVFLGAFVDSPDDQEHLESLQEYCEEVLLRPLGGWRSLVGAASSLIRGQALGIGYYRDRKMSAWTADLIDAGKVDSVIAFSSTMAQYGQSAAIARLPYVVDFVDVDSDKWRQYSLDKRFPISLLYRYEAARLARWERRVAAFADAIVLVSDAERDLMCEVLAGQNASVEVARNGVDIEFFNPNIEFENPYRSDSKVVVFTGAMDYYANEAAVLWFARKIWNRIYREMQNVEFHIVGSNPTAAVKSLSLEAGISVVGRVPDIRPYLKHAVVAVAPLRIARGVQNKVLEALAMCLPIVATPQALQGIDGILPESVQVADSESVFVKSVLQPLHSEGARDNETGRNFVRDNFDWDRNLSVFSSLVSRGEAVHSISRRSPDSTAG